MNKAFYLRFDRDWYKRNDLLSVGNQRVRVIKVYRRTKWRRFIGWLGFKNHLFDGQIEVKVK